MNEKFSETTTRQNKINLLKSKIRDEIKEDEINIKLNMKILLEYNDLNYDAWKCCVDKAFFLESLKIFINSEKSFWSLIAGDYNTDTAIYNISLDDINIWLQEDYNFVHRLFFLVENRLGMLDFILTDKFLGMELISTYEWVLYSKRIETRLI